MTNIQSKSLIPFCKFIDKSVIHVSIFYMHCVRQLLIHFLYIDDLNLRFDSIILDIFKYFIFNKIIIDIRIDTLIKLT